MLPKNLRELLEKLEYLALINPNEKPNVNSLTFVAADSWKGSFQRLLHGESREHTIQVIEEYMRDALQALEEYRKSDYLLQLANTIKRARTGIERLVTTYSDSPGIIAKLKVIIMDTDHQLASVTKG